MINIIVFMSKAFIVILVFLFFLVLLYSIINFILIFCLDFEYNLTDIIKNVWSSYSYSNYNDVIDSIKKISNIYEYQTDEVTIDFETK